MTGHILSQEELSRLLANQSALQEASTASLDSPVLDTLASVDRESLAELITERHCVPGEIICKEGDPGDAMYIILSGRVAIVKGDFETPTILAYRAVGEIIGEMALIENRPRFASVVAVEDVRLLQVSRANFEQLVTRRPEINLKISEALSIRLRAADEARASDSVTRRQLANQVSELRTEKQQLLELQQLQQETVDLIVHDLRNPLSLIAGAINLLEMSLPAQVLQANRDILDLANTNSAHMKRLVESLLDVTRLESGEVPLSLRAVHLPDLAQKTVDRMTAMLARTHNIGIQASLPADLPPVVVDEEKIDRVLANLIDNAVRHTPDEEVVVVSAELKEGEILVSVSNPGPVIPAEDRERIFERFTQVSLRKAGRGFGLGLRFCRLAVEAHGGHIWVEPREADTGNRFVFSLPLSVQAATIAT